MAARNSRKKRRQCTQKVKHDNQTQAVDALIALKKKGSLGVHTYKCPFCKKWHVGHAPRKRN